MESGCYTLKKGYCILGVVLYKLDNGGQRISKQLQPQQNL